MANYEYEPYIREVGRFSGHFSNLSVFSFMLIFPIHDFHVFDDLLLLVLITIVGYFHCQVSSLFSLYKATITYTSYYRPRLLPNARISLAFWIKMANGGIHPSLLD